jgi:phosphoglycerate dehydrogenase-like enzyme
MHCPLLWQTRGMINAASSSRMKPGSFLIYAARGPLWSSRTSQTRSTRDVWQAAVDVFSGKPPPLNNPLPYAKKRIVTPHIGSATKEARMRLIASGATDLRAFLDGHSIDVVNYKKSFRLYRKSFRRYFWPVAPMLRGGSRWRPCGRPLYSWPTREKMPGNGS